MKKEQKKQYDDIFEAAAAAKRERQRQKKLEDLKANWIAIVSLLIALASLIVSILK